MFKKLLALSCIVCLLFTGCGKEQDTTQSPQDGKNQPLVGVSLAGQQGELALQVTQQLEKQGFRVELFCAGNSASTQAGQLQTLLIAGAQVLIVQAVDSLALKDVEETAKVKNVPIIALDTLLMDTDWVWGYLSYDYEALGATMARKVVAEKQLDAEDAKACTIEFFFGAPENHSAYLLCKGAMEVFQPYLNAGKLVCRSGRTTFEDAYTAGTVDAARSACAHRLAENYGKKKLDICFAASDAIATGCRYALDDGGYTRSNWPVLIGQGGENTQTVKDGYQLVTYERNPFVMARTCAEMAKMAADGQPFQGDGSAQDNHVISVPGKILPVAEIGPSN